MMRKTSLRQTRRMVGLWLATMIQTAQRSGPSFRCIIRRRRRQPPTRPPPCRRRGTSCSSWTEGRATNGLTRQRDVSGGSERGGGCALSGARARRCDGAGSLAVPAGGGTPVRCGHARPGGRQGYRHGAERAGPDAGGADIVIVPKAVLGLYVLSVIVGWL